MKRIAFIILIVASSSDASAKSCFKKQNMKATC